MPTCIGLFVNVRAGKGKSLAISQAIAEFLKARGRRFELLLSGWPDQLDRFDEAWIIGGDGTLNYFINKYRDIKIPMVIFKGGTGNDFAWHLYGEISLETQTELVLDVKGRPVDAGVCNGRYFINGMGIGFDGEVVRSMLSGNLLRGHLKYLWAVIKTILNYREPIYEVNNGDGISANKFLIFIIANASRAGGGFLVSPESNCNDGYLNVITCKPLSLFKRLINLPLIKKGMHLRLSFIQQQKIKHLQITCRKKTAAHIDGEFMEADEFKIEILPSHYLFKYPP